MDEIVSYIAAELANPQAAADFVARLQKIINETRSFPESGTQVNNEFLPDIGLRKKNVDNYIMYYLPIFEKKRYISCVSSMAKETQTKFCAILIYKKY